MTKLYENNFRPKIGETYYIPCFINMFEKRIWKNERDGYIYYYRGLVFETEDEAIKTTIKMLKAIRD